MIKFFQRLIVWPAEAICGTSEMLSESLLKLLSAQATFRLTSHCQYGCSSIPPLKHLSCCQGVAVLQHLRM